MEIGIGLPATIPGVDGALVLDWARQADQLGFSSVGIVDRLVYDNFEPLVTLAAVAGATRRIRLATTILITPYRVNAALLAKQAASVDRLSGGRLALGMGIGARDDDYVVSGAPARGRGRRFDEMLEEMARTWSGQTGVGPAARPEVLIGGISDMAYTRAARHGSGWVAGSADPKTVGEWVERLRSEWARQGRTGEPRVVGFAYFSLGPDAREHARGYLAHYYAFAGVGEDWAEAMALTGADAIRQAVDGYRAAGCTELILYPCAADLDQVGLLADITLGG
jgi:alkanesulfonate monooxygenase SsuD/methylene tetrahydromethanopterin reductase-like flavin-dependent oxidoreductase (luciferase family)